MGRSFISGIQVCIQHNFLSHLTSSLVFMLKMYFLFSFYICSCTSSLSWKECSLHSQSAAQLFCFGRTPTSPTYSLMASSSGQVLTTPSFVRVFHHSKTPLPLSFLLPFLYSFLLSFFSYFFSYFLCSYH